MLEASFALLLTPVALKFGGGPELGARRTPLAVHIEFFGENVDCDARMVA